MWIKQWICIYRIYKLEHYYYKMSSIRDWIKDNLTFFPFHYFCYQILFYVSLQINCNIWQKKPVQKPPGWGQNIYHRNEQLLAGYLRYIKILPPPETIYLWLIICVLKVCLCLMKIWGLKILHQWYIVVYDLGKKWILFFLINMIICFSIYKKLYNLNK